jgi:hypothetical protein
MDREPLKRLMALFVDLRRRGLDDRIATSAERWAVEEIRRAPTTPVENLALRAVSMWRAAWSATDAAAAEAKKPTNPAPRPTEPTPPPAKSAEAGNLVRRAFAG